MNDEGERVKDEKTRKIAQHIPTKVDSGRSVGEEGGTSAMEKKQPEVKEVAVPEDRLKISDLLNFTSAIFVVIGTAILYFSGWIYVSAWYGFYGIDLSQVQISTQVILIYGIPATFITAFIICVSVFVTTRVVGKRRDLSKKNQSVPLIALFSCSFSIIATFLISWRAENFISDDAAIQYVLTSKSTSTFHWMLFLLLILILIILFLSVIVPKISRRNAISKATHQELPVQSGLYLGSLSQAWQLWAVMFFLICFLTIITIAWQFGTIDAYQGTHFMTGNLEPADVNLYSGVQISALEEFKRDGDDSNGFIYGPLLLVHSDQSVYYLSDPKKVDRFSSGPKVFIVPKTDEIVFFIETKDWFVAVSDRPKRFASPTVAVTALPTLSITSTHSPQP